MNWRKALLYGEKDKRYKVKLNGKVIIEETTVCREYAGGGRINSYFDFMDDMEIEEVIDNKEIIGG
ncbi:MAG: hypothetical protein ACRCVJ_11830 [Clostridium sp.]|uniref:hypothetical protein n=1 Tax=Clostridium sp. TaxID=1506 RepID=UPI003F38BE8A